MAKPLPRNADETTAAAPTPEDRAMVRRFGFLGLPSERMGGALSFSGLRAELGEDNAASLVMRLGELVKVHHLDQLGVPLDRAVDHILQSLTPQERRSIVEGNALPPRVEAFISAEAGAAKAQEPSKKSEQEQADAAAAPAEARDV